MSFLGLSATNNYSTLALPLYYGLCLVPHFYAVQIADQGDLTNHDNRNPRSPEHKDRLKQRLDPATYARYERAVSAHHNSLEGFPLFAAAVILGNLAKLDNEELNTFVAGIGILRVIYIVAYISTVRQRYTYFRSALWAASLSWMFRVLWRAGKVLM